MWKDILLNYGIFLLELLTIFGVVAVIVMIILESKKHPENGTIVLTDFSEKYKEEKKACDLFMYFQCVGTLDTLDDLLDNENIANNEEYYNFVENEHDVLFESGIYKTIELEK